MSNSLINIRIGIRHLHLTRDWEWSWGPNEFHRGHPEGRWAIYTFFGLERIWRQ